MRESDRGGRWEARAGSPAELRKPSPEWRIEHQGARFWIRPTAFKHVGIFPEQAANWDWIERVRRELGPGEPAAWRESTASVIASSRNIRLATVR